MLKFHLEFITFSFVIAMWQLTFSYYRVVYPLRTKSGAYADIVMSSSCLDKKKYDMSSDSCI